MSQESIADVHDTFSRVLSVGALIPQQLIDTDCLENVTSLSSHAVSG